MVRPAFSLFELLMLLAVLSVILALVLPTSNLVHGQAQQLQCQGNLAQVGAQSLLFAAEHKGDLPPLFYRYSAGQKMGSTRIAIEERTLASSGLSYFSRSIRVCPADPMPSHLPVKHGPQSIETISYAFNIELAGQPNRALRQNPDWVMYFDGIGGRVQDGGPGIEDQFDHSVDLARTAWRPRHQDQGQVLYTDGHVASQTRLEAGEIKVGKVRLPASHRPAVPISTPTPDLDALSEFSQPMLPPPPVDDLRTVPAGPAPE